MTYSTKKLGGMKKAWLVRWGCYGQNENRCLRRVGIKEKIVDVISVRKTFKQIMDIAKEIYCREQLSISEKIFLENYSNGKKRKKDFFQRTPIFTNYTTNAYWDFMKSFRENGMNHPTTNKFFSQWRKHPIHISIGINPTLEVKLIFNLVVYQNKDDIETIEWDEQLVDGTCKKERYEYKK